jgi:hypothetical protein
LFEDFLFYKEWASQRRSVISSVKFDTDGAGKNLPESRIIKHKYEKTLDKSFFSKIEDLVDNSILGTFKDNVLDLAVSLYKKTTVVENTESTRIVLEDIINRLYNTNQLKPETLFKVYGMLTNIILQNNMLEPGLRERWWKENMLGKFSIANEIAKLINSEEMKGNYLFDNLLSIDFSTKENEPDVITFDNSVRIDTNMERVIIEGFKDFASRKPDLYNKMIQMSLKLHQ